MTTKYWVNVRDKPGFFTVLARFLAGSAHLSLEGDLSTCHFSSELAPSSAETPVLKRVTIAPELDFVVLPLDGHTVERILEAVSHGKIAKAIIHVQIEKDGELALGAYDNFHKECVVTGPAVSSSLLEQLRGKGIIRSFEQAPDSEVSPNA